MNYNLKKPICQMEQSKRSGLFARLAEIAYADKKKATAYAKAIGFTKTQFFDVDGAQAYIFSNKDGSATEMFKHYIGGLQKYMPEALLIFAPYSNSYRRFLSYWSSPVNLEWATDNRSVGLRVPDCEPQNRRVENRLAGSDVNPYLVLAATLACGYMGIEEKIEPRKAIEGSAYDLPFSLHRHMYASIDAFSQSKAMRKMFGDSFVDMYSGIKQKEHEKFQEIITPWEREVLMLNV